MSITPDTTFLEENLYIEKGGENNIGFSTFAESKVCYAKTNYEFDKTQRTNIQTYTNDSIEAEIEEIENITEEDLKDRYDDELFELAGRVSFVDNESKMKEYIEEVASDSANYCD